MNDHERPTDDVEPRSTDEAERGPAVAGRDENRDGQSESGMAAEDPGSSSKPPVAKLDVVVLSADGVSVPLEASPEPEPQVDVIPFERALLDGVCDFAGRRLADVGIVPVFADERPLQGLGGHLDWRCSGYLSELIRTGMCSGDVGDALLLPGRRGLPTKRLVLFGSGPRARYDDRAAEALAVRLIDVARGLRARDVLLALPAQSRDRARTEVFFSAFLAAVCTPIGGQMSAGSLSTGPRRSPMQWWIVAEPDMVARLRRIKDGPPRATSMSKH